MSAISTIQQLLAEQRFDDAIEEFNTTYLPSARFVSHKSREELKKCLLVLFAQIVIPHESSLNAPAVPVPVVQPPLLVPKEEPVSQSPVRVNEVNRIRALENKIKKLEARKEEIRQYGLQCFNDLEEYKARFSQLEDERDTLINDTKILEGEIDRLQQQLRYHQSNSQALETKCKTLQKEFENARVVLQNSQGSYSSQSENQYYDSGSSLSPKMAVQDSMESDNEPNFSAPTVFGVTRKLQDRYPVIDKDLVPQANPSYAISRQTAKGPQRESKRFPEQRTTQPTREKTSKSSKTSKSDVTRNRSPTTINDLVHAKYLFENEQVRAFSPKSGMFLGVITLGDKNQYGIMDNGGQPTSVVFPNPSKWVKREAVLNAVGKRISIIRKSQYSGWECVKVLRNVGNSPKWVKLSQIRKEYDTAIANASQSSQGYQFEQNPYISNAFNSITY